MFARLLEGVPVEEILQEYPESGPTLATSAFEVDRLDDAKRTSRVGASGTRMYPADTVVAGEVLLVSIQLPGNVVLDFAPSTCPQSLRPGGQTTQFQLRSPSR